MNPPKLSKFSSRQFKIEYQEEIESEGDLCHGLCLTDERRIKVMTGLPPELEAETLIHETLHQLVAFSGMGLSDTLEETTVDYFAKSLIAHMKDNKGYWRYIRYLLNKKDA